MQVLKIDSSKPLTENKAFQDLLRAIRNENLLAMPTDTVYGLIGDARSKNVVDNIHHFKNRPQGMGISVFVRDLNMAKRYVNISPQHTKLIEHLAGGKYTFILPSKGVLPKELEDNRGTLGIRIIQNTLINEIIKDCNFPLTATSANIHGRANILSSDSFVKNIPQERQKYIQYLLEGQLSSAQASTVLDLSVDRPKVLRHGKVLDRFESHSTEETRQISLTIWNKYLNLFENTPNVVISLEGELGSGKTQFAKQIGEIFGIRDMTSPSYQLLQEYENLKNNSEFDHLYHADLYFLENDSSIETIGLKKLLNQEQKNSRSIFLIEWGDYGGVLLGDWPHLRVVIGRLKNDQNARKIEVFAHLLG